jgi:putative oxidoreductase
MESNSSKAQNIGILILRLGIGLAFIFFHGWSKLTGGPDTWTALGQTMGLFGIHFYPTFWGFASACAEFIGGILILLGLYFRPATFFLTLNMLVASVSVIHRGSPSYNYPIEIGIVILSLFFIGPGKYSLDNWRSSRGRLF